MKNFKTFSKTIYFSRKCLLGTSSLPATVNLKQRLHDSPFGCLMVRNYFLLTNHKKKDTIDVKDLKKSQLIFYLLPILNNFQLSNSKYA